MYGITGDAGERSVLPMLLAGLGWLQLCWS